MSRAFETIFRATRLFNKQTKKKRNTSRGGIFLLKNDLLYTMMLTVWYTVDLKGENRARFDY